jgi:polyisoprenyl-phosphate glycosyltransferase
MDKLLFLSIVLPAHNEASNILPVYQSLIEVLDDDILSKFEIIFVDDGSADNTAEAVEMLSEKDPRVKLIQLFRNFGHQNALTAGLANASGDVIVTMDSDLQHPAEVIKEMLAKYNEGNDVVYTVRRGKQNGILKNLLSSLFYKVFNRVTGMNISKDSSDFRLISRKVADNLIAMHEKNRFLRGMTPWIGGRSAVVEYIANPRVHGAPSYTLNKSFALAITGLLSFSTFPLKAIFFLGVLCSTVSLGYGLYIVGHKIFIGTAVPGYTDIVASVLFLNGLQFVSLGIIGRFLVIVLDEIRDRPNYIIRRTIGIEK